VTRILIGADVGGSKTAVGVSDGETVLSRAEGPGAAVRPGRALASSSVIAEVVRQDVAIEDGKVKQYRVRLAISFKYESGE